MADRSLSIVPAVVITGPYAVGKSTILSEVAWLAASLDIPHAAIDVSQVRRIHPRPQSELRRLRGRNVAALWEAYAAAGAVYLALADHDVHSRTDLDAWLKQAVPGVDYVVFRLRASPESLIARVTEREGGWSRAEREQSEHLRWARGEAERYERYAPEDHLIETDDRDGADIAQEILRIAGWPGE